MRTAVRAWSVNSYMSGFWSDRHSETDISVPITMQRHRLLSVYGTIIYKSRFLQQSRINGDFKQITGTASPLDRKLNENCLIR